MYSSARTHPGGALASAASRIMRKFLMISRKTWRSSCRRAMASGSFMVPHHLLCDVVQFGASSLLAVRMPRRPGSSPITAPNVSRATSAERSHSTARRQQANDDVRLLPVLTQ